MQDILYSRWNGKSALMLAAQGGHIETVEALINAGADVSFYTNSYCYVN